MILAHTVGGPGGVEIELLVVAVGFFVAAFFFRPSQPGGNARTAVIVAVVGVALLAGSFALPRLQTPAKSSSAVLKIVEPKEGAEVAAGEATTVRVDLANAPLATSPTSSSGGHLHLYVDGKLQQMPYSKKVQVTLDEGEHEIRVEYVDAQHLSFEPSVEVSVEVTAQ